MRKALMGHSKDWSQRDRLLKELAALRGKPGTGGTVGRGKPKSKPYDPLQPLTGRAFGREVERTARLRYAPEQAQIGAERRISKQQMVNIPHWYDQYLALSEQMRQATQAGYQQAQASVNQQTAQSVGQDTALNKQVQAEAQKSAAVRGTTAAPGVGAQALAARTALSNQMAGLIASHGASQNAFGATRTAAGGAAKLGALREEQGHRRTIEGAARQLARERGDYKAQVRGQLREGERKFALETSAFGLDVAEAKEAQRAAKAREKLNRRNAELVARDKAIDNMLQERRFQLDLRKFGADKAKENYQRRHGLGPYKPSSQGGSSGGGSRAFTPTQVRGNRSDFRTLVGWWRSNPKATKIPAGYSKDPLMRRAAAQVIRNGGVSPKTARQFRRAFGFTPKVGKPTTRKPKRPGPQTS